MKIITDRNARVYNPGNVRLTLERDRTDVLEFNDADLRMARYALAELYYTNRVYTGVNKFLDVLRKESRLYRHIRGVDNPVHRIVEAYVANVYGGAVDTQAFNRGSLPIVDARGNPLDERTVAALRYAVTTSRWRTRKSLYPRQLAKFGDCFLKVVDLPDDKVAFLEVLDPRRVLRYEADAKGDITYILIGYEVVDEDHPDEQLYYFEEITPDQWSIWDQVRVNTVESVLYTPPTLRYANDYGFVPVVVAHFTETDAAFSTNAFFAQIPQIDEMNDVASLLNDNIRKAVDQVYFAEGITKGALSSNQGEPTRDMLKIVYAQAGGKISPLTSNLDIMGTLQVLKTMHDRLIDAFPVLSLHQMREMSQATGAAIRTGFHDAIVAIEQAQENADEPLERALRMLIAIAGYRGYIRGFNLSYATEMDAWSIRPRPVLHDRVDKTTRLNLLLTLDASAPQAQTIYRELELDPSEIEAIDTRVREAQQEERLMSTLNAARLGSERLGAARTVPDLSNNDMMEASENERLAQQQRATTDGSGNDSRNPTT